MFMLGTPMRLSLPLVLLLGACATTDAPIESAAQPVALPSAQPQPAAELIPRELLFGNPERASAQISPDGSMISFLAPVEGVLNVWVGPVDDIEAARPVTDDTHRGIRWYGWTYDSDALVYGQDEDGDENWHLFRVPVEGGEAVDLVPVEGVTVRPMATSPDQPDTFIVGINDRDPALHDVYRLDVDSGERELVYQNDQGFVGFVIDHDLELRLGVRMTPDGGAEYLAPDFTQEPPSWEPVLTVGHEDEMTTSIWGFDASNERVYLSDSRGRDTAAAMALDLGSGELELLAEDARADVSGSMMHPTEHRLEAVAFEYEREHWVVLDEAVQADLELLGQLEDGELAVTDRSLDDRYWLVLFHDDDGPARYYHFDRETDEARFLFTSRPALEDLELVPMHPVIIPSRDGLNLVSYLTLPAASDPDADGRPDAPVPLVLDVHGGPWARDSWDLNPMHQWLANRGYAVLSVNFRGSTGFGKTFVNAGDKEWAGAMHDDLLDAVGWAVEQGITAPDSVAIMGGSYGGYATLVGLTFTPEVFACGVDIVGPSNLVTLLESIPPYWKPMLDLFHVRVGDNTTDEGRAFLESRSPLFRVDEIQRPLLIAQGANDPRVKQAEADQIVEAMQERGIPVTYALYPDEGHGFARPENRMSFYAVTEGFLGACLGGPAQPLGEDLEGSSLQVPVGADIIDGLEAALSAE
jgi:dipeptidyl aminopeptidase/acylaminoacyl peptidase